MPVKSENHEDVEISQEARHFPLFKLSRRVLLASVGAVSLAQEEIEDFINRLVERGEIAENEGRKIMEEVIQRRKTRREKIKEVAAKKMKGLIDRLDVPTKKDIEKLNDQISILTRKIEALKKNE